VITDGRFCGDHRGGIGRNSIQNPVKSAVMHTRPISTRTTQISATRRIW
jgi:hypothetical protein